MYAFTRGNVTTIPGTRLAVIAVYGRKHAGMLGFRTLVRGTGVTVIACHRRVLACPHSRVAGIRCTEFAVIAIYLCIYASGLGVTGVRGTLVVIITSPCAVLAFLSGRCIRVTPIDCTGIAIIAGLHHKTAIPGCPVTRIVGARIVILALGSMLTCACLWVTGIDGALIVVVTGLGRIMAHPVVIAHIVGTRIAIIALCIRFTGLALGHRVVLACMGHIRCIRVTVIQGTRVIIGTINTLVDTLARIRVALIRCTYTAVIAVLGCVRTLTRCRVTPVHCTRVLVIAPHRQVLTPAGYRITTVRGALVSVIAVLGCICTLTGLCIAGIDRAQIVVITLGLGFASTV